MLGGHVSGDPDHEDLAEAAVEDAFNGDAGSNYGTGIDGGVNFRHNLTPPEKDKRDSESQLLLGVQGGVFLPGDAFAYPTGGIGGATELGLQYLVKARAAVTF